jgi:hypothetical protein
VVKDQRPSAASRGVGGKRPPWLTRDVADAILALTGAATLTAAFAALTPQAAAYIREVRAQYRSDVRERTNTTLEADLPNGSTVERIASARLARQQKGAGGGRRRHREHPDT